MIVHHPFVVSLGSVALSGYGIAAALALALVFVVVWREYARLGVPPEAVEDVMILALVGLVGAKAYDVLTGGAAWFARGGFSMVGGILLVPPTAWWLARRRGLHLAQFLDPLALGIAAAIPVARTGCWAIGDDYGRPTTLPWAVAFPQGAPPSTAHTMATRFQEPLTTSSPEAVIAVHPTQLYEAAIGLAIFFVVWRRRKQMAPLEATSVVLVATALSRLLVEAARAKTDRLPNGTTITQWVCLLVVLGALELWRRVRVAANSPQPL